MWNRNNFRIIIFTTILLVANSVIADNINDSLSSLLKRTHEIDKKAKLLYQLSYHNKETNPDTAIIVALEALELSEKINENLQTAKLHRLLGELYVKTDEVSLAVKEFYAAEEMLTLLDDKSELLKSYMGLGNIYIQRDNLPEAMENYNKAISLAEYLDDSLSLPRLYNNLGILNLYLNNNEKALELYSKALSLFKNIEDTINVAGTTTNIGSIYIQLGNYDIARDYYKQGLNLFKSINLIEGEAHALLKLGLLEIMQNNFDVALNYLNQSIKKQEEVEITYSGIKSIFLAETLINRGIIHIKKGQFADAIDDLNEGMEIASRSGDIGLMALASDYISQYYAQLNNYEKSLEYHQLFKQYSDSITNESSIRKLAQLEMQLQYEEKTFEQKIKNQKLVQKEQRNTLYAVLFASVLVMGLALLFVLLRLANNKKKKAELAQLNLEEKLEHTNKELTTYVMYLLRKNEFIISISEKLKHAKLEAKTENKQRIAELITELENNSKMFSWEEFEVRFQQVYIGFYKILNEKFPDLSQNEIRLCAFAKLNMTTKEIAAITYQSINSITVARYRLRKKLGLKQDENLHSFITEL